PGRPSHPLARHAAGLFEQELDIAPDQAGGEFALLAGKKGLETLQTLVLDGFSYVKLHLGARSSGPRRIFEGEGLGVGDLLNEPHRVLEIGSAFAGEADDEI